MKPTTLTHQRSITNSATSRVANLRMQIGHNLATSRVANPTTLTSAIPTPHSATSTAQLNVSVAARLNASVATLLNADPMSPSKETAKEENR